MGVNDNACCLDERVAWASIAGKPAQGIEYIPETQVGS